MEEMTLLAPLSLSDVSTKGNWVTVKCGWRYVGKFLKSRSELPEEGCYALFTIHTYTRKGLLVGKVASVDRLYFEPTGIKKVRIFGTLSDKARYASYESVTIRLDAQILLAGLKTIVVEVVEHAGELLFSHKEVLFDRLDACPYFEHGQLHIYRDNSLLAQTESINEYGTHASTTCFIGLRLPGSDMHSGYARSCLLPKEFQVGDRLTLRVPVGQKFNFASYLRVNIAEQSALLRAFRNQGSMTFDEMQESFAQELDTETTENYLKSQVLRFSKM